MDYRPNISAMLWFAQEVMPLLRQNFRTPRLWIVGMNPARSVRDLAGPDICVTGRVPDVRPYLRHARVVVAPLGVARGIQNKVIEAMAMGCPIVVTPQVAESLPGHSDDVVLTAATPEQFAEAVLRVMRGEYLYAGARAREYALTHFRWGEQLAGLDRLLEADTSSLVAAHGLALMANR